MATAFAKRVASVAQQLHDRFHFTNEADPALCREIRKWTEGIGFSFTSCTDVPWSAVFVSWCMKQAGATKDEFAFAMAHSVFVHRAIQNATAGGGVFQGFDIAGAAPEMGDVIHHNRGGHAFTFAFAKANRQYESHSVVVVETGVDSEGRFAFCVGGNERDSIRQTVVRLDAGGLIKPRTGNAFISVIKNLK
jgi:hypothetical protein